MRQALDFRNGVRIQRDLKGCVFFDEIIGSLRVVFILESFGIVCGVVELFGLLHVV